MQKLKKKIILKFNLIVIINHTGLEVSSWAPDNHTSLRKHVDSQTA